MRGPRGLFLLLIITRYNKAIKKKEIQEKIEECNVEGYSEGMYSKNKKVQTEMENTIVPG